MQGYQLVIYGERCHPKEVSGRQQQRVALARTLVAEHRPSPLGHILEQSGSKAKSESR